MFMDDSRFSPNDWQMEISLYANLWKNACPQGCPSCARYSLELGVNIFAWESMSEDLI